MIKTFEAFKQEDYYVRLGLDFEKPNFICLSDKVKVEIISKLEEKNVGLIKPKDFQTWSIIGVYPNPYKFFSYPEQLNWLIDGVNHIDIYEAKDEYFYVKFDRGGVYPYWYRCDQLEGLLTLIDHVFIKKDI